MRILAEIQPPVYDDFPQLLPVVTTGILKKPLNGATTKDVFARPQNMTLCPADLLQDEQTIAWRHMRDQLLNNIIAMLALNELPNLLPFTLELLLDESLLFLRAMLHERLDYSTTERFR